MRLTRLTLSLLLLAGPVAVAAEEQQEPRSSRDGQVTDSAPDRSRSPIPVGEPTQWIVAEDYPAEAVQERLEGRVDVELTVDADGLPTSCAVRRSSGSAALDTATCDLLMVRARFRPALDRNGEAVEGTWSNTIVWQVPAEPVPEAGRLLAWLVVEKDGTVSSCEVELAEGAAASAFGSLCNGGRFQPPLDDAGNPTRTMIRMLLYISHEDPPQ